MTCIAPEFGAYRYRDAEPVEDPEFVRSMAVSYTHLDVYKRQWLDSGAVASNTLTLTSNTSSSASYTDTVDTGDRCV